MVVQVNGSLSVGPAVVARVCGHHVVWNVNDTVLPPWIAKIWGRNIIANLASSVVCIGDHVIDHFGLDRQSCRVVRPSPSVSTSRLERQRASNGEMESEVRVGLIGNWNPEKGVDLFVKAFAEAHSSLAEQDIELRGALAGAKLETQARYLQIVEGTIERLGIGEYLSVLGFIEEIESVYVDLDIVVIPSRSEGIPTVMLEAMYLGVPVIASRIAGVQEVLNVIEDGDGVVLVEKGDVRGFAEAIVRVAVDLDWRREAARKGRQIVREVFSIEREAEGFEGSWSSVVM